jgi:hypothetical protein
MEIVDLVMVKVLIRPKKRVSTKVEFSSDLKSGEKVEKGHP